MEVKVYTHGGREETEPGRRRMAKKVLPGAGEILLTSMDCDGTKGGLDNALNRAVSEAVEVPVIASAVPHT